MDQVSRKVRHVRRREAALERQFGKALLRLANIGVFIDTPEDVSGELLTKQSYKAWHAGLITDRQALVLGLTVNGRSL